MAMVMRASRSHCQGSQRSCPLLPTREHPPSAWFSGWCMYEMLLSHLKAGDWFVVSLLPLD